MNLNLFNRVDLVIVPIILLLLLFFILRLRKKQPEELQKFFLSAFLLRVFGTFTFTIIYQYVYGFGDTFAYYHITQVISSYFPSNVSGWLTILFTDTKSTHPIVLDCLEKIHENNIIEEIIFQGAPNANVSKVAAVFNIICFNSYIAMALIFGTLSFLGCWYIFKTFVHIYPGYEKQFSIFCLFLPSLWFWGNGILKDPICIFGLGILFYNFFVKKKGIVKRLILIVFGAFILISIKSYIFYAFASAVVFGYLYEFFRKTSIIGKVLIFIFSASLMAVLFTTLSEIITNSFMDMIEQSLYFAQSYSVSGSSGDGNEIPVIDPTPAGFVKLSMQGLVTVFMKPFPWDIRKILYLFVIMENVLLYYIFFKKIKTGPVSFLKNHRRLLSFCFIFFIFMGIVIGVTTFNLGTIVRYRVPALPFLFAGFFCLKLRVRKKKIDKAERSLVKEAEIKYTVPENLHIR